YTAGNHAPAVCAEDNTPAVYHLGCIAFTADAEQHILGVQASAVEQDTAGRGHAVDAPAAGAVVRAGADPPAPLGGYAGPHGGPAVSVGWGWNFRGEISAGRVVCTGDWQDGIEKAVRYALSAFLAKLSVWKKHKK